MELTIELLRKHSQYLLERMKNKDGSSKGPSPQKAKKMLADDSAQGHPLTDKQKSFFRALAHGWKPTGKKSKKKRKAA